MDGAMEMIEARASTDLHRPPSPQSIQNAVAYLKKFRSGLGQATMSLQELVIKSVLKNYQRFLAVHLDNADSAPSLENLPTPVAEKLLVAIESDLGLSQEEKRSLALLLASRSTNHLDYRLFRSNGKSLGSDTPFFKKMASDCPNLKALDVSHRVWKEFDEPGQCCLLKVIACKWKNLNVLCLDAREYTMDGLEPLFQDLGCRTTPCQGYSIIRAICRHLPRLRTLKATVPPLTCEDVDDLSQMQHLTYLSLNLMMESPLYVEAYKSAPELVLHVDALVRAAGSIPTLKKFNFCFSNAGFQAPYVEFVDRFAKFYPKKKIIIEQIWLQSNLLESWPENVSVEELHISGEDPVMDWDALLQIKGPIKKLFLYYKVPEQKVYSLVETFGSDLTHLALVPDISEESPPDQICLRRVLLACEKLEVFKMRSAMTFYGSLPIDPDHFKLCHEFRVWHQDDSHPHGLNHEVVELTKNYYVGSEQYLKKLVVSTSNDLEALIQALEMDPAHTCLDRLEEIYFLVQVNPTIMLRDVTKAVVLLMMRSPYLVKVVIFDDKNFYFPPYWFHSLLLSVGISLNKMDQFQQEFDLQKDHFNYVFFHQQTCLKLHENRAHRSFNIVGFDDVKII